MTRWAPEKKDVLAALADEITHNYGRGRVIIAIDGIDVAGTADFADAFADTLRTKGQSVFRASIEGFHRPRAERYLRGRDSPEGLYRDSYDYAAFERMLIAPFRMAGSTGFVLESFDVHRDTRAEPKWVTGGPDAFLIVDGSFLNRPELRGFWNYSVWLQVAVPVAAARLVDRDRAGDAGIDGIAGTERRLRYSGAQALYATETKPATRATAIIDNSDLDHPRRVFADSC
jgi:uridine kinase